MSQLVPCPSCGRHVRLPSASCPFCDVAIDTAVLGERFAPRRSNVQSGVKRAMIFAVGASMAAACGGETDPAPDPDPSVQPVYGAPIEPSSSATGETSVDDTTDDDTSEPMAQPEYGAPVPADSSVQAIYGAPVSPSSTEQPTLGQPEYGAPVPPDPIDAGAEDAGSADAAVDASDPETIDPDPGPSVQPLYGAPVLN